MIVTHRARIPVLKSSSLALMCSLSDEAKEHLKGGQSHQELWRKAMELHVKLEKDKSGNWRLEKKEMDVHIE